MYREMVIRERDEVGKGVILKCECTTGRKLGEIISRTPDLLTPVDEMQDEIQGLSDEELERRLDECIGARQNVRAKKKGRQLQVSKDGTLSLKHVKKGKKKDERVATELI